MQKLELVRSSPYCVDIVPKFKYHLQSIQKQDPIPNHPTSLHKTSPINNLFLQYKSFFLLDFRLTYPWFLYEFLYTEN